MSSPVQISVGALVFDGELNDTVTARRVYEALPIEAAVNRWGDEIYFRTSVEAESSEADRTEMQVGELAFWPPGRAVCIFWGPTPASEGDEPRAASEVVSIGRLSGDSSQLPAVADGEAIRIERR